ncbi:hypothetical protein GGS20DRAFT_597600 [Poronia punctata]|nr:hypothetical protein GGS20DRAFT_597600 [Poronia punctata]
MPRRHHTNSRAPVVTDWCDGEIAFLKQAGRFNTAEREDLLDGKAPYQMDARATGHPVIVLARSTGRYLIATVSAFSSSEADGYRAPWKKSAHKYKGRDSFRAFEGSERPNDRHDFLRLRDGGAWPKPKTSWVQVNNVYLVPSSVLIRFTKSPDPLFMDLASLKDLTSYMAVRSGRYRQLREELEGGTGYDESPLRQEPWRCSAQGQACPAQSIPTAPCQPEKSSSARPSQQGARAKQECVDGTAAIKPRTWAAIASGATPAPSLSVDVIPARKVQSVGGK